MADLSMLKCQGLALRKHYSGISEGNAAITISMSSFLRKIYVYIILGSDFSASGRTKSGPVFHLSGVLLTSSNIDNASWIC
eukprot:scaffold312998_cov25-Prasinocladus_malaysianus.AAC.2